MLKLAILTEDYNLASLGALFQEIKFQLNVAFDTIKINACPRSCNMAAHGVGFRDGYFETWVSQFPKFVINSVAGDSASMI
jgi:hypothetical protein